MISRISLLSFVSITVASFFPTASTRAQDSAASSTRRSNAIREAATHDDLANSLRMAQQNDPMRNLGPAIGDTEKDPAATLAGRDLVKDSLILCFRGELTLLPKRAVLFMPEPLESRSKAMDGAAVKTWEDFFQKNRGWIRTVEVSREQAMGQAALPKNVVDAFATSSSVIVATFNGGPISVLPYVDPEKAAETSAPAN